MANVKEIQDRIKSVNDTMKITNAMYMISSNKLRKARKSLEETEPYFMYVTSMIRRLMRHLPDNTQDIYLEGDEVPDEKDLTAGIIVITDDKGLAGAYNHNVIRIAEELMERYGDFKLYVIGEVGRQYFIRNNVPITEEFRYTAQDPTMSRARRVASYVLEDYTERKIDRLYLVYTEMKNSLISEARKSRLLPRSRVEDADKVRAGEEIMRGSSEVNLREYFLMDPSPEAVLDNIFPTLVTGYIYGALVESFCSVQNARMVAMDSANKNAKEMIKALSMSYNRERQAMITQEITEIASGAKALRHAKEVAEQKRAAELEQKNA